jgi:hypothetical protein
MQEEWLSKIMEAFAMKLKEHKALNEIFSAV